MRDLLSRLAELNFSDISEPQPRATKTPIELRARSELTALQLQWRDDGVVILRDFIPDELRTAYCLAREKALPKDRSKRDNFWGGWHYAYPYMVCEELMQIALYRPLTEIMRQLIGEEMGLHLALTGWVSTERNFHQDTYLNPPDVWSFYLASWFALDDIHPDAGPFQFVRGSHQWDVLRREKLFQYLTTEEQESPNWPSFTQDRISRLCEEEIERHGAKIEEFTPTGGDVLIWHSNLIHRGSQPRNPELLRKSLIGHYSSVKRRPDFRDHRVHANGSHFFGFPPPALQALDLPASRSIEIPALRHSFLSRLFKRRST